MSGPRAAAVLALGAALATYAAIVRPWMLDWGASTAERMYPLPGDGLVPDAHYVTTRAATIGAPPDRVWPWLVQMGQRRR